MLLAQITDLHIKLPGVLAYKKVDTAVCLRACVERLNALSPRPDAVLVDPQAAQLRGAVESALFLGERTRLKIRDAAPDALIVDVPGRVELAQGTAVGISVRDEGWVALH